MSREKRISGKIVKALSKFCWCDTTTVTTYGKKGAPDIYGCVNGLAFFIEVKTPTGKTSQIQVAQQKRIKEKGGGHVVTCTSVEEAVDAVRSLGCWS